MLTSHHALLTEPPSPATPPAYKSSYPTMARMRPPHRAASHRKIRASDAMQRTRARLLPDILKDPIHVAQIGTSPAHAAIASPEHFW